MLKPEYSSLQEAMHDFSSTINNSSEQVTEQVTSEFVRLNDVNMFVDTGASKRSVVTDTEYKKGIVKGTTPYFSYVYFGTSKMNAGGNTGKPEPFLYTYEENVENLVDLMGTLYENEL